MRVLPILLHDGDAGDLPRAVHCADLRDELLQPVQRLPEAQVIDSRNARPEGRAEGRRVLRT